MPKRRAHALAAAAVFLLPFVLVAGGCLNDGVRSHSDADLQTRPVYPEDKPQDAVLDIQVVRDETQVTMTNTTATAFGPSRLWLNRWYSREIDGLDVGQTIELSLAEFKDRYGEPFRAGGFFATRRPDRLAQMQLQTQDGRMLGLICIPERDL